VVWISLYSLILCQDSLEALSRVLLGIWLTLFKDGSLAVAEGRSIAPTINKLLTFPFILKIATKDWHPADHISFASNHEAPDNQPFVSIATITNPLNPSETQKSRLWPIHCVQGTFGAQLVPELDSSRLDQIVEKGQDCRVEMYSALYDPFRVSDSGLVATLKESGITHVFVAGLAFDYCVKCTAEDAAAEGFVTYIIREATKAVDPTVWADIERELTEKGVIMIHADGKEIDGVKSLSTN